MPTYADGLYQWGGMPVTGGIPPFVSRNSKVFFVDPVNGADGNSGESPDDAFASLYRAHYKMTSGNNDACFLVGNGAASGTCRLSLANAIAAQGPSETAATTGTLTWSKSACHLIGITAPGNYGRARIAPPTGTYTEATFNALPFITFSGSGCYVANLSIYHGFSTGADGMIALNLTGSRNTFVNTSILGMNDAASAQGTSSRSLKINTSDGENTFIGCVIGGDTTERTVANASLELAGGTPRNAFYDCTFPVQTSSADIHMILGTGNACIDRWNLFKQCKFINNVKSSSTTADDAVSFSTNAPGGLLLMENCSSIGFTKWGDTNGLANMYVSNVGGAATDGLMLAPT